MYPYVLLIFISLIFGFVSFSRNERGSVVLLAGSNSRIQNRSLLIPIFFILFFFLLALRHESIGVDVKQYRMIYEAITQMNLEQVLKMSGDKLYNIFNWVISRIIDDFRLVIVITAAIILIPIFMVYSEDRDYSFLKIIMFMNMPTFIMVFSGFRQAIAFSIGLIAYKFVREKKLIWFLIFALIAFGFHHSGFIILLFYPLYHISFKAKHLWFVIPAMALVYVFNKPIFTSITFFLNSVFGEDYSAEASDTGAYTMLILFILLAVFSYVIPDETLLDKETLGLRNFLLMAVVIQSFVPLHVLAMRMNYYFVLFIPILIPKILKCSKYSLRQVSQLSGFVMTAYFLVYYLDKLYTSCMSGVSSLGTYPYLFFWQ